MSPIEERMSEFGLTLSEDGRVRPRRRGPAVRRASCPAFKTHRVFMYEYELSVHHIFTTLRSTASCFAPHATREICNPHKWFLASSGAFSAITWQGRSL